MDVDVENVQYHQDDSYYRMLYAAYVSEHTGETLDVGLYLEAIVVNPIPRYFWNSKPALMQDFWRGYKSYYVTLTFLGELFALLGLWPGAIGGLVFLMFTYRLLDRAYSVVVQPLGLAVYFIVFFYVNQCMRAIPNVTSSIYFPIGTLALSFLVRRRHGGWQRFAATRMPGLTPLAHPGAMQMPMAPAPDTLRQP